MPENKDLEERLRRIRKEKGLDIERQEIPEKTNEVICCRSAGSLESTLADKDPWLLPHEYPKDYIQVLMAEDGDLFVSNAAQILYQGLEEKPRIVVYKLRDCETLPDDTLKERIFEEICSIKFPWINNIPWAKYPYAAGPQHMKCSELTNYLNLAVLPVSVTGLGFYLLKHANSLISLPILLGIPVLGYAAGIAATLFACKRARSKAYGKIRKAVQNADCSYGNVNATAEEMEQLIYQKTAAAANFLQIKEEFEIAVQVWLKAWETFDEKYEKRIMLELGNNYYKQKRYEEAVQLIKEILDSNPENDTGWLLLGDCYAAEKQHKPASEAYARAIKINPKKSEYHAHYAENLMRSGQLGPAEEEIKIALSEEQFNISALKTHARILEQMDKKRYNRSLAIEVYRRALHLDPLDKEAKEGIRRLLQH